jgi:hypothetical protein
MVPEILVPEDRKTRLRETSENSETEHRENFAQTLRTLPLNIRQTIRAGQKKIGRNICLDEFCRCTKFEKNQLINKKVFFLLTVVSEVAKLCEMHDFEP